MNKKHICSILLLSLCLSSSLIGRETRFEFRSAAFFPSSQRFRDIYGTAGVDFQLQASQDLLENLAFWVNLDRFSKHGHSIGFSDPTRFKILNLSLGLNFIYPITCNWIFYAGLGPSVGQVWLKNKLHLDGTHRTSKTAWGGVAKVGTYYDFTDRFYLDLFLDYLYQPVHFKKHVDVGGTKLGAGIGVKF